MQISAAAATMSSPAAPAAHASSAFGSLSAAMDSGSDAGAANPSAGAGPAAPQFSLQVLIALMNAAQGDALQPCRTGADGLPELNQAAPKMSGPHPSMAVGIFSSAGTADPARIASMSSDQLAEDLQGAYGRGGTLTLSEVDGALGFAGDSENAKFMQKEAAADWDFLTNGSPSVSTAQLTGVIQKYLKAASG